MGTKKAPKPTGRLIKVSIACHRALKIKAARKGISIGELVEVQNKQATAISK